MTVRIKVLELPETDEYSVIFSLGEHVIEAMINYCPYAIQKGSEYDVNINFTNFENSDWRISLVEEIALRHIKGYSYEAVGRYLGNSKIDIGIIIYCKEVDYYPVNIDDYISFKIDRLDIDFE